MFDWCNKKDKLVEDSKYLKVAYSTIRSYVVSTNASKELNEFLTSLSGLNLCVVMSKAGVAEIHNRLSSYKNSDIVRSKLFILANKIMTSTHNEILEQARHELVNNTIKLLPPGSPKVMGNNNNIDILATLVVMCLIELGD